MEGIGTPTRPVARQNGLVVQELDGETLIFDMVSNRAHCLNSSASLVWKSCDGTKSVDEIANLFAVNGHGDVSEDFVWLAIDKLGERELLQDTVAKRFPNMSRRAVVKKVGLAAAAALPVIASLAAPQSALASASCACVTPGDCVTQTGCPSQVNCNPSGVCAP